MNLKQHFAQQFKSARQRKGLSLQALAEALNHLVTRQALHRYEKGEVLPDSQKLVAIATVFGVNPDYFFRTTPVELGEIAFSQINRLPQKEIIRIHAITREYLARYLELEQLLNIKTAFKNPLQHLEPIRRMEQVEDAAIQLRKKWHLGEGTWYNVLDVLEDKGIKVLSLNLGTSIQGLQTSVNQKIPVIAYASRLDLSPCAKRLVLLHELGHLLLPFASVSHKQKELLCQGFAEAMLLPANALQNELGKKRNKIALFELAAIQAQYGLPMSSILRRAGNMGIIGSSTVTSLLLRLKKAQGSKAVFDAYQGVEASKRFEQLLFRALLEEQITMSKAAALMNCSMAEFRETFPFAL